MLAKSKLISEIKSSLVKRKQIERRCSILKKLMEIDFTVFSLVIDKRALNSKGFQYHSSFFKFCNRSHKIRKRDDSEESYGIGADIYK